MDTARSRSIRPAVKVNGTAPAGGSCATSLARPSLHGSFAKVTTKYVSARRGKEVEDFTALRACRQDMAQQELPGTLTDFPLRMKEKLAPAHMGKLGYATAVTEAAAAPREC